MTILVGFHVEGHDYLVFRCLIARLLNVDELSTEPDRLDTTSMGWQTVLQVAPKALERFYNRGAQMAVIGVDNDGNQDLLAHGLTEDPKRPRHWNHMGRSMPDCRRCQLEQLVIDTRARLTYLPEKPGGSWPVVVVVPVEMIEAWLLVARAIAGGADGSLHAEREARTGQKMRFYGRPEPTREDLESRALPLLRGLSTEHLSLLEQHSQSYRDFADQVRAYTPIIRGPSDCWRRGDRAAEVPAIPI
jgi:hypothetical protein